jgi:hypothetical protein
VLLLVVATIPALLQIRDTAKELEFTLRETRTTIAQVRQVAEKADGVIEQGRTLVEGAGRAFSAVEGTIGNAQMRKGLSFAATALQALPVAIAAFRLVRQFRRKA